MCLDTTDLLPVEGTVAARAIAGFERTVTAWWALSMEWYRSTISAVEALRDDEPDVIGVVVWAERLLTRDGLSLSRSQEASSRCDVWSAVIRRSVTCFPWARVAVVRLHVMAGHTVRFLQFSRFPILTSEARRRPRLLTQAGETLLEVG